MTLRNKKNDSPADFGLNEFELQGCQICETTFKEKQSAIAHYCSLPHHIKQERVQPTSVHKCALCAVSCKTLSDYSRHLDCKMHERLLANCFQPVGSSVIRFANYKEKTQGAPVKRHYLLTAPDTRQGNDWRSSCPSGSFNGARCNSVYPDVRNCYFRSNNDRSTPWNNRESNHSAIITRFRRSPSPRGSQPLGLSSSLPSTIIRSTVSVIEPEVPLDIRNLAPNSRRYIFDSHLQRKRPAEQLLDEVASKTSSDSDCRSTAGDSPPSSTAEVTTTCALDNNPSADEESPERNAVVGREADSTTSSIGAEKIILGPSYFPSTSSKLSTMLKRRLAAAQTARLSDRLLADRLNRYKVVDPTTTTTTVDSVASTSTLAYSNIEPEPASTVVAQIKEEDCEPIELSPEPVRKSPVRRASAHTNDGDLESTNAERSPDSATTLANGDYNQPSATVKEETPDIIFYDDPILPSSTKTLLPSTNVQSMSSVVKSADSDAPMSNLQSLWLVCKREEELRLEQKTLDGEMERLKQELHTVWCRQREVQKEAEQCMREKQVLLKMLEQIGPSAEPQFHRRN